MEATICRLERQAERDRNQRIGFWALWAVAILMFFSTVFLIEKVFAAKAKESALRTVALQIVTPICGAIVSVADTFSNYFTSAGTGNPTNSTAGSR
jgi:hypothetical protein